MLILAILSGLASLVSLYLLLRPSPPRAPYRRVQVRTGRSHDPARFVLRDPYGKDWEVDANGLVELPRTLHGMDVVPVRRDTGCCSEPIRLDLRTARSLPVVSIP